MSLKTFEHVLIFTEDLEASHDFYVNMNLSTEMDLAGSQRRQH